MESSCCNRLLAGTAAHGEEPKQEVFSQELQPMGNTLEHSVPKGVDTMERIHVGAVVVELQPGERTHVAAVHEVLYLSGGTILWDRETV